MVITDSGLLFWATLYVFCNCSVSNQNKTILLCTQKLTRELANLVCRA